jgi:hypothetical protein
MDAIARLIDALNVFEDEVRTLARCPACYRKRTVRTLDLMPLGWIAKCSRYTCGFLWFRRNGPPEFVGGPKRHYALGRCRR